MTTAGISEDTGVASAYDEEFESMEAKLEETKKKLSDANISKEHIEQLENEVAKLKKEVGAAREKLDGIEARVSNATQAVDFAEEDLKQLQADAVRLTEAADDLRDRTIRSKRLMYSVPGRRAVFVVVNRVWREQLVKQIKQGAVLLLKRDLKLQREATQKRQKRSSPEQIRALAEEVLAKKISLTPEQIADLTAKTDIEEAKRLLSERTQGNEAPQKRAEALRQRASKLLYKAQRSSDDISVLTKDASDVRLDDYQRTLDELNSRLEQVTKDIHASTEFFASCDV
ncbi:hypothetical protein COOONC_15998 [Cooperia oncophora]